MVYAVDFDGVCCTSAYPDIGEPNVVLIEYLKALRAQGNKLILWTCRDGVLLWKALVWCAHRGLIFDAHNANLPERIDMFGSDPRKIGADVYIDDHAVTPEMLLKGLID